MQRSRVQIKQTLTTVMVKFCEMKQTSKALLFLIKNFCMTEIKSNCPLAGVW